MALEELLNATKAQLADEDMGFSLWLPNDEEMLEERTMALAQWCSGFLAGLGSSGDEALKAMSDDANEALKDLQQISTADVAIPMKAKRMKLPLQKLLNTYAS